MITYMHRDDECKRSVESNLLGRFRDDGHVPPQVLRCAGRILSTPSLVRALVAICLHQAGRLAPASVNRRELKANRGELKVQ